MGASPDEISTMNGLSVNLHLCLTSFYQPTDTRYKILMEDFAFCSDQHVVWSHTKLKKQDPARSIITTKPREGEFSVHTEDILKIIDEQGESIALVMLAAVQFYTGQFFELEKITKAAHAKGCIVAFDLAHAVGNVPMKLHEWGIDWACWCTYKYLNSGPGCISGIFIHERHHNKSFEELPRFLGWWGQTPENRFKMSGTHQWKSGAQSYMLSNPPVLPILCLEAALELQLEATSEGLREKSLKLTGYLEILLDHELKDAFAIMTPRDPRQRGCQLSLLLKTPVKPICKKLQEIGVTVDSREPHCLRVAPNPLFNTFTEVYDFVHLLQEVLNSSPTSSSTQTHGKRKTPPS